MPELHHRADYCCSRSKSLLAAEKVGKSRSTDASYLRRHLNNGLRLPVLLLLSHCSQSSRLRWLTCNLQSESSCAMAVCTNDRRRGLGQVQNRYGCGATKMYLSRLFAKKPMKASHRRSKTTVSERAFLHAVDLCSTVSRKTESKPIWFPDMSKTRQPAYPRNIIFKKTKCACAMEEIETSNGNHSIRQRLPSRKTA